jgi:hypothetical protein
MPYEYYAVSGTWTATPPATTGNPIYYRLTNTGGVANEYIEFKTVLQAGTYSIGLLYDTDINRGIFTMSVDGVNTGSTIDSYSNPRVNAQFSNFTTSYVLATSKLVTIRLTAATKNGSSSGYILGLYGLVIRRSA